MLWTTLIAALLGEAPAPSQAFADLVREPATAAERQRVEVVLDGCPRASRRHIDPFSVLALVRLEDQLGVPPEARGILPAVWCIESAFRPAENLLGDLGQALGPAQFHMPLAAWCMGDHRGRDWRGDFIFSARCWITHVTRNLDRATKLCGDKRAWQVAEAVVSNVRKYGWRCTSKSAHWRLAERFREAQSTHPPPATAPAPPPL